MWATKWEAYKIDGWAGINHLNCASLSTESSVMPNREEIETITIIMINTVKMKNTVPSNTPRLGNRDRIGPGWGRFSFLKWPARSWRLISATEKNVTSHVVTIHEFL